MAAAPAATSSTPLSAQLRVVDLLDGFGPGQYDVSSVQFGQPDKVVSWGQGDAGVASTSHNDINGQPVKDMNIYIYHEGKNPDNKTTHDEGALGGVKIIQEAQVKNGVNCLSDEKPFQSFYVKVSNNDVLCIKNRAGDKYVLAQVMQVGTNGIRLRVFAGPQTAAYFPEIGDDVPVKVSAAGTSTGGAQR